MSELDFDRATEAASEGERGPWSVGELTLRITDDGVFIGESEIIIIDLVTSNGVIHVIDAVLVNDAILNG